VAVSIVRTISPSHPMPATLSRFIRQSSLVAVALCAAALVADAQSPLRPGDRFYPPPFIQREFRGVWVATVSNIDWPSEPGLSTQQQQDELIAILDRASALNLNAVILQV